ncbi:MAG TPA: divergent polysaccharide deacetylase family protein [Desulfobacterales bacterium]|nr:divergent polysaccharide deacetylase family protein [Desulfobacterales bacterium]
MSRVNRRKFLKTSLASFLGMVFSPCLASEALSCTRLVLPIPKKIREKPKVAIIIDDIGNDPAPALELLDLGFPITFSILPWRPFSHELALEIGDKGHEIMLHQPMEPIRRDISPGPGALFVTSTAEEIVRKIEENLAQLPWVTGVNNHMGSRFTSTPSKVRPALEVIKTHGLFFVDSVTTNKTVAYRTAKSLRMHTTHRDLFLDHIPCVQSIKRQLKRLEKRALLKGQAIAIGHPFPDTVTALREHLASFDPENSCIEYVYVSSLL